MFLVVLALGACRRGTPTAPKADAVVAPTVSCEAVGRMNLTALAALPDLGRLTTTWLSTGAPELSAALRDGAIDPLAGMERAQICQTSRRSPTGGREFAVTMSGRALPRCSGAWRHARGRQAGPTPAARRRRPARQRSDLGGPAGAEARDGHDRGDSCGGSSRRRPTTPSPPEVATRCCR
jgi:hypothetical protein